MWKEHIPEHCFLWVVYYYECALAHLVLANLVMCTWHVHKAKFDLSFMLSSEFRLKIMRWNFAKIISKCHHYSVGKKTDVIINIHLPRSMLQSTPPSPGDTLYCTLESAEATDNYNLQQLHNKVSILYSTRKLHRTSHRTLMCYRICLRCVS